MADFKIASAFVEVDLKDRTPQQEAELRRRLERGGPVNFDTALKDPKNTEAIRKAIEAGPAAKIRAEVDNDGDRLTKSGEQAGRTLGDAITRGAKSKAKDTDDVFGSVAARANAQFKAMEFGAYFAGLPIAAAAAGAATGAALGGVPLLFAGIAAAAQRDNPVVAKAFSDLSAHVRGSVTEMSGVLADDFAASAGKAGAAFDRLEPRIAAAMKGSEAAVDHLTDGVIGLAENAMPGLNTAIDRSDAPMRGWESLLKQTGSGVSDFFANLSEGAEGSGEILETTGGIIRDFLGATGDVLANLSTNGNPALEQFQGILQQIYDAANDLTSSGSAMYDFLSGFGQGVSGALAVGQGFIGMLNMLPDGLTEFGGSLLAVSKLSSMFGFNMAGNLPIFSAIQRAANDTNQRGLSPFKQALADADRDGTSKFKAGLGTLAASFGPWSAAVGLGTVLLSEIGARQQEAAAKASEHKQRVDELAAAYRQSGGAIDDNIAQINMKALADKHAAENLNTFGQSVNTAGAAIEGNRAAYDALLGSANKVIDSYQQQGKISDKVADAMRRQNEMALEQGLTADGLVTDFGNLTQAEWRHIEAIQNGLGTVGQQIKQNREARQAWLEMEAVLADVTTGHIEAMEAMQKQQHAAETMLGAALGLSGALDTLEDANKAVADAEREHGRSSEQYTDAQRERAAVLMQVADAARSKAEADYKGASETERAHQGTMAYNQSLAEQVRLLGSEVGPDILNYVAQMDAATAAASGFEIGVNSANEAIVRLPDGKEVKITGNADDARRVMDELAAQKITNTLFTDTGPATGQVKDWANMARSIDGETTTYTNTDPATGAVQQWKVITDHTGAKTTVMTSTDPATGAVQVWKQRTDGTWAQVKVGADTAAANAAINYAARDRWGNIYMKYVGYGGKSGNGIAGGLKDGGEVSWANLYGFADGGEAWRHFDGGGPVTGPGGPRDDKIPSLLSNGEIVINAQDAQEDREGLLAVNAGVPPAQAFGLGAAGQSADAASASTVINLHGDIVIDAKSVKDLNSMVEFFDRVIPAARQGASTLAGVRS